MGKRPRGPQPGWKPTSPKQIVVSNDIEARYKQHYREGTLPRGGRGIFYDLRPDGMGNGITYRKQGKGATTASAEYVQDTLSMLRRAGTIPESWVADGRAHSPYRVVSYDDADEYARAVAYEVKNSFRLDAQRNQPVFIELLIEAADLVPRIARVARTYGVPVYTGSGFDGLKGKRSIAARAATRTVPTVVMHIGDGDKKGEEIYGAVAEDAVAWAQKRERIAGWIAPLDSPIEKVDAIATRGETRLPDEPFLLFHRIGLTIKQATELNLVDEEGKAEVDAVPVATLDKWVQDAIETLQDPARREELRAEEERERKRLPDAIRDALDDGDALDE